MAAPKRIDKAKSKKKKIIIIVLIIILVIAASLTATVYFVFKVNEITFVGSSHYTDEQLTERVFGTDSPNSLIYWAFNRENKTIPFIQKYDVEYQWPDKLYVTVYEKSIVGYISYMGCKMYFDKDGIVVESSTEDYEGVPEIVGLSFKSIVLDSKLDVGSDSIFSQILDLTQSFDKYDLNVNKVFFDSDMKVYLYIGNVKVSLGSSDNYSDKLFALKQMSEKFGNLSGTLYLDDYDGNSNSAVFKMN